MEHKEFRRIVPDAQTAVLFIHGIVGTPNHFVELLPLVPPNHSVWNLLLDGHGAAVKDFSATSMKKWEDQVQQAVDVLLEQHESIYIVAHSMGTLFAIEQAVKNSRIKKLFLLAVPIKVFLKPAAVITSTKVLFDWVRPDDKAAQAAKRCYGVAGDKNLLHYIPWLGRFLELLGKIRQTRTLLPTLKIDCKVYQSYNDELVARSTIPYLESFGSIDIHVLKKSGHFYYEEADMAFLLKEFQAFIAQ